MERHLIFSCPSTLRPHRRLADKPLRNVYTSRHTRGFRTHYSNAGIDDARVCCGGRIVVNLRKFDRKPDRISYVICGGRDVTTLRPIARVYVRENSLLLCADKSLILLSPYGSRVPGTFVRKHSPCRSRHINIHEAFEKKQKDEKIEMKRNGRRKKKMAAANVRESTSNGLSENVI